MLKFEEYRPGWFKVTDLAGDYIGSVGLRVEGVFFYISDPVYGELSFEQIAKLKEFMEGLKDA